MNYVILLSAGVGKRLGLGINKGFVTVNDKTLLEINIENFLKHKKINSLIIVTDSKSLIPAMEITNKYQNGSIPINVIVGGKERQDSAFNGLKFLKRMPINDDDVVIFHNVANPLFSHQEVTSVITECNKYGSAAVGRKVKNTIRNVNKLKISTGVICRDNLYEMETPQASLFGIAFSSFTKAFSKNYYGTDDVELIEKAGFKVKIVESSEENFKITTEKDLQLAKLIFKNNE